MTIAEIWLGGKLQECIAAIASQYDKEKQEASKKKMYVKRGVLKKLILEAKKEFGLNESIKISEETIWMWENIGHTEIIKIWGLCSPLEENRECVCWVFVEMGMFK